MSDDNLVRIDVEDRRPPPNPPKHPKKSSATTAGGGAQDQYATSVASIVTLLSELSRKLDVLISQGASTRGSGPSNTSIMADLLPEISLKLDVLTQTLAAGQGAIAGASKSDEDEERQTLVKCMEQLNAVNFRMPLTYVQGFNILRKEKEMREMFLRVPQDKKADVIRGFYN